MLGAVIDKRLPVEQVRERVLIRRVQGDDLPFSEGQRRRAAPDRAHPSSGGEIGADPVADDPPVAVRGEASGAVQDERSQPGPLGSWMTSGLSMSRAALIT